MPLSQTGKADRKALRTIISQISRSDMQIYSLRQGPDRVRGTQDHVQSQLHAQLLQTVARVLVLALEEIQGSDNFFHIGGDSISAIKLVNEARKVLGLDLTVADIFQHPTIPEMSQQGQRKQSDLPVAIDAYSAIPPFSILDASKVEMLKELAVKQCSVLPSQIEDIYPCSPLQERLMARTARLPGAFQANFTFRVSQHIDWARFRGAWDNIAMSYTIMRTRIITMGQLNESPYNTLQVVIRGQCMEWLEEYRDSDRTPERQMSFGTPLIYLVASRSSETYPYPCNASCSL